MSHNIEAMTRCLSTLVKEDFSFDLHSMYFERTGPELREKNHSAFAQQFRDAFHIASTGEDDGTALEVLWAPWLANFDNVRPKTRRGCFG